jgi:hypothetical protein
VRHVLFNVLVMTLPRESPLTAVLADLALAPGQDPNFRGTVAWWAREKGLVTAALVRAWATHDAKQLRDAAWWLVAQGKLLPPAEGWPLVLERLERALPLNEEGSFPGALFVTLEAAPWPQDRERTAKALLAQLHTGHSLSGMPTAPQTLARERYLEVLSRVFELTTDENVGGRVLSAMQQLLPKDVRGLRTVATWARTAPTRQRRDIAVMELANHAERQEGGLSAEDIEVFDDLLTDPSIPVEESGQAWQRTFQGRLGADLIRSPKALRRLLDRMRGVADGHMGSRLANALLQPVRSNLVGPEPIVEALLAAPDQAPSHLLGSGSLQKALVDRRQLPRWRQAWREAWPRWNDEQRRSGIFLLSQLLAPGDEPEMVAFLRERLRSRPSEIPVGVREVAMRTFGELTWDDLKAAYDLSKVEEVDAAAGWFVSPGGNQPSLVGEQPKVKPTAEIFAALRPALRPDSPTAFLGAAPRVFRDVPEVHRELAAVLLASDGVYHASAVELLASRAAPEDEDLWLKALRDARVDVRVAAARGMERVPTDGLKRALVGALDDPHPDVRAAALASLDNLQKMEDLKARWRERVK